MAYKEKVKKIFENKKVNGVELYFHEKPSEEIREKLKSFNFRFHKKKGCWYAKLNDHVVDFVNSTFVECEDI